MGVIIQEVDDTTPPRVVSATVDLGTKVMIISSNEWIDSTPSSLVDLSNTHVSNWVMEDNAPLQVERDPYSVGFGSANITLAGADVVAFDGYNVTIHLTELMRTGLLFLSGHPWDNIDGVAIDGNAYTEGELVIPPGALMDIGQNRQTENAVIKLIEFPDQVKPVLIRAVVDYNDGKLELYPSETLHNVMANIDLSRIWITNNTLGVGDTVTTEGYYRRFRLTELGGVLAGPVLTSGPSGHFEVTLNEVQRVSAIRISNTPGGDLSASILIELDAGAIIDLSMNTNNAQDSIPTSEIPDTTPPAISSTATLDYSTGILSVAFDETVAASQGTGVGGVDVSKIYLSNVAGDLNFNILGASIPPIDLLSFDVILSESVRALAIALSGTPGGDGIPLNLETRALGFYDVAGNGNPVITVSALTELPDIVPPVAQTASINFGTGVVIVNCSETIDTTPITLLLLSNLFVSQQVNGRDVSLVGDSTFPLDPDNNRLDSVQIISYDTTSFTVTVTEAMRISAVALSNSAGLNGNNAGTNAIIDVLANAIVDVATNRNQGDVGVSVIEIPDSIAPTVLSATINYGTGIVHLYMSETIDATAGSGVATVFNQHYLRAHENDTTFLIDFTGATLNQRDHSIVELEMHEQTRATTLEHSNTLGGDGSTLMLEVKGSAMSDLYNNPSIARLPFLLLETPDTVVPTVLSVTLDFHTGNLSLHMSETMDATPPQGNCNDASTWLDSSISYGCPGSWLLDDSALLELIETPGSRLNTIKLKSANPQSSQYLAPPEHIDSTTIRLVLDEDARVAALLQSSTSGGDGDALFLTVGRFFAHDLARNWIVSADHVDLVVTEIADTVQPLVAFVEVHCHNGTVHIWMDETVRLVPNTLLNRSKIRFSNIGETALMNNRTKVSLQDATLDYTDRNDRDLVLTMPEDQRAKYIAQSGTSGGDGGSMFLEMLPGAVQDMAFNINPMQIISQVTEYPDEVRPEIVSAIIHLSNGTLVLQGSETIDVTPQNVKVNATMIFLHDQRLFWNGFTAGGAVDYPLSMYQDQNLHHFTLRGATVLPESDDVDITLQLTESQRARAIAISSTSGGDVDAIRITVKAGALVDVAGNPNLLASDMSVLEHNDTVFPSLVSAEMWMSNGTLIVEMDEYVDVTPYVEKINFHQMYLGNALSDRVTSLVGSTATAVDGYRVTITVPEVTRVRAIEQSGTAGGDGNSGFYLMDEGALMDVAQNVNPSNEGIVIQEHRDNKRPRAVSASMNFSDGVLTVIFDETLDMTPADSLVNLTRLRVETRMAEDGWGMRAGWEDTYNSQTNTTVIFGDTPLVAPVANVGVDSDQIQEIDGLSMKIRVPEAKRVLILKQSRLYLVNESEVPLDHNLEPGDLNPYFGTTVTCMPSNHEQMRVRCFYPTAFLPSPTHYLFLKLDDGVGVDIAGNEITFPTGSRLSIDEVLDTVRPTVTSGTLHLSDGVLSLILSETIDITPSFYVALAHLRIVNSTNTTSILDPFSTVDGIIMYGGRVSSLDDSVIVNITVSEVQRAQLIAMSATPGGDGITTSLTVLPGAFRDLSSNLNVLHEGVSLLEIPDVVTPTIISASMNYGTNVLLLNTTETIDCTPASLVDATKLYFSDDGSNDRLIRLSFAQVVQVDGTLFTLILDEATRVQALSKSSVVGGDGAPLTVDADVGAAQDVAGNPSDSVISLILEEIADSVTPSIVSIRLNLSSSVLTIRTTETIRLNQNAPTTTTSLKMSYIYISNITLVDTTTHGSTLNLHDKAVVIGDRTYYDHFEYDLLVSEALRVDILKLAPEYRQKLRTEGATSMDDTSSYPHTIVMDVFEGAFQDMASLNVSSTYDISIVLYEDVVLPQLIDVTVDFSGGYLIMNADETIDLSSVNLDFITLTAHAGQVSTLSSCYEDLLSMCNGTVITSNADSKTVRIRMSENVRVASQYATLNLGSDAPLYLNIRRGALMDVAGNLMATTSSFNTSEIHDTSQPHLLSSTINFADSYMTLVFNETLDLTPWVNYVNLTKLLMTNHADTSQHDQTTDVRMTGASVREIDAATIQVDLTEKQRVALLLQSAALHQDTATTYAGDGTALYTSVEFGFVSDLRENPSVSTFGMLTTEVNDDSVPFISSAQLYLETGEVVIVSSETLDRTRTSTADFTFMNTLVSPGPGDFISLAGGIIRETAEGGNMTVVLSEAQRVSLIRVSGQSGGDGEPVVLQTVVGGITDLSGNPSVTGGVVPVQEFADESNPRMESVSIDYNDGMLTFTTSETSRAGSLNLTRLFLINSTEWADASDVHGNQNIHAMLEASYDTFSSTPGVISLVGADTSFGTETNDLLTLRIQMTERQRSSAVRLSSTPVGGDGGNIIVVALSGTFKDVALNNNVETSLTATEIYDVDPPEIIAVSIFYATGIMVFTLDETTDAVLASQGGLSGADETPTALQNIYIVNDPAGGTGSGQTGEPLYLNGAFLTPSSQENTTITISITEIQRVQFHGISASRDSTAIRVVVNAGAFRDVSSNLNGAMNTALVATEIVDGTFPTIISASLNFSNGIMVLESTETLDVDNDSVGTSLSKIDLSLLHVVNQTGDVPSVDFTQVLPPGGVDVSGGSVIPLDGTSITLQMLEAKRVVALRISGTPGGDNTTTILDVLSGAFRDIAGNLVTSSMNLLINEYPDVVSPLVTTAAMHLGTGLLTLSFGETVDGRVTPLDLARGWMGFNVMNELVMLLNVTTPLTERNTTLQFQVNEVQRIRLVKLLQLDPIVNAHLSLPRAFAVDLAGNPSKYAPNITVVSTSDIIPPYVTSIFLNYSDGSMDIHANEMLDVTNPQQLDLSKILLRNTATGTDLLSSLDSSTNGHPTTTYTHTDGTILRLILPESLRVYILSFSGTPGGDGGAAVVQIDANSVTDIALNSLTAVPADSSAANSIVLQEYADTTRPRLIDVEVDYGVGHVVISASETIDATPASYVQSGQLYISNTPGDFFLPLNGADVVEADGLAITLTLSESARAGALRLSGTPGGDGGGVLVDIGYGACRDMAGNLIAAATNLPVTETADSIIPSVTRVTISFGDGRVRLYVSETILPAPIYQSQMFFGNIRVPFYETVNVNVAAVLNQENYESWGITVPVPTVPPLTVGACHISLCQASTSMQIYVKNMNRINSDATDITSGTASTYMNMLKSYVAAINDNANSPIELRISGLISGQQYQITTYHHSRVGTGAPHDGMRVVVVESDGSGGITERTAHTGFYWSTGATANLEDVTCVTDVTAGSDIVDNSFRGFTYTVALKFYMSGSGGTYRNLLPLNGLTVQLKPPSTPRGPSEVDPVLDVPFQMNSATLLTPLWNDTYPYVEFQLQELQRVQFLEISGMNPGGDGDALMLDIYNSTFSDLAGNGMNTIYGIVVEEERDDVKPNVTHVEVDFGTSKITMNITELVRMDNHHDDLTKLIYANNSQDLTSCLSSNYVNTTLSCRGTVGYTGTETYVLNTTGVYPLQYSNQIQIQLGEGVRVEMLQMSSTIGGDGDALHFGLMSGFFIDLSGNPSNAVQFPEIIEIVDDVPPTASLVDLNLDSGRLVVEFRETIDLTTYGVNLNAIVLSNTTEGADAAELRLNGATTMLNGSSFVTSVVTLLTEEQRAWAVLHSGTSGGDGVQLTLRLEANAFFDLSGNGNEAVGFAVHETADSTPPAVVSAVIDYETGTIYIEMSETIKYDISDRWPMSYFHVSKMFLSNGTTPIIELPVDPNQLRSVPGDYVSLHGSRIENYQGGTSVTIHLLESTRVQGIEMSGTKGGDAYWLGDGVWNTSTNNITTVEWNHTENARRYEAAKEWSKCHFIMKAGAVSDIAVNIIANTDVSGSLLTERADARSPQITNVTIDFGLKEMYILTDETIDVTPVSEHISLNNMYIANTTGDNYLPLVGVLGSATLPAIDTTALTLTITEAQKLSAAAASSTQPYGDNIATIFELGYGALRDIAGNFIAAVSEFPIVELPDTIPPKILSASINYSTGEVIIFGDESILAEPSDRVVTSSISIVNNNITFEDGISLEGASVTPVSGQLITMHITELQRSRGVLISGTSGGDGISSHLNFQAGSLQDVFGVLMNDTVITFVEYPDIIIPKINYVQLFFDSGRLEITATETILSSDVIVNRLYIANSTSSHDINLVGATVQSPGVRNQLHDNITITILLPEVFRVRALHLSSQTLTTDASIQVGDGTPVVLDVLNQALFDPARLDVPMTFGFPIVEIADEIGPLIAHVEYHLGLGRLTITFDETIDFTLPTNPNRLHIRDAGNTETFFEMPSNALNGLINSISAVMVVDERTRVQSIQTSGTSGGDGVQLRLDYLNNAVSDLVNNTNVERLSIAIAEISDIIAPVPINGTVDLSKPISEIPNNHGKQQLYDLSLTHGGVFSLEFSEILNVSIDDFRYTFPNKIHLGRLPRTGVTEFGNLILDPLPVTIERESLNDVDFTTSFFAMSETLRIALIRNTNNGEEPTVSDVNSGAVRDVAFNGNVDVTNIPIHIIPDLDLPNVISCSLNYSTGVLLITFSETIDVPEDWNTAINLQHVALQNSSGLHATQFNAVTNAPPPYDDETYPERGVVLLAGATLVVKDSSVVEIVLSETMRAQTIAMSGVIGGDVVGVVLDVYAPSALSPIDHAFRDVALNPIVPKFNLVVTEYPDVVLPTLLSINIDYMSGLLSFSFDETIDATPASVKILLNEITIHDWRGGGSFLLDTHGGSEVVEIDGTMLNMTLKPRQRWGLLFIYDQSVEISAFTGIQIESPVRSVILPTAFQDLAGNALFGGVNRMNVTDSGGSYVVRSITDLLSDVGEGHIATFGYEKLFSFNGSGISLGLVADRAKWVSGDFTEANQCGEFDSRNASGAPQGEGVVNGVIHVQPGGNRVSFNEPSPTGNPYKLCYRFSDEPYKLFQTVRLTVKQVTGVAVLPGEQGADDRAVVDKPKSFTLVGYGVEDNDAVRFVPHGKEENDDCTTSLPLNAAGYAGDLVSKNVFRTTFVTPSALGRPHMLCVRFNQEPWALVRPAIVVRAARLESVGGAYGGALLNVGASFVFTSDHISGYIMGDGSGNTLQQNTQVGVTNVQDKVKWVYQDASRYNQVTNQVANNNNNNIDPCLQEPALDSQTQSVKRNDEGQSYGTATFVFRTMDTQNSLMEQLTLCYKFATEPFALYTNMALNVYDPNIESVNTPIVVKDVAKRLIFSGTLSSTKDDLVKWVVPFLSSNKNAPCSQVAQGGQVPQTTLPLLEDFTKKTADVLFTEIVSSTTSSTSWALCYKFGTGPYVYFDAHRLTVGHLTNVTALTSESQVVVTNTTMRYKAGGVGLSDLDSAMFIRRNETSCDNGVTPVAGPAPLVDNAFAVRFGESTGDDSLQLCYKFQSEPYVLYPNVEMVEQKSIVDGYYDNLRRVDAQ